MNDSPLNGAPLNGAPTGGAPTGGNDGTGGGPAVPAAAILQALSSPVFLLDGSNRLAFVNAATEQFFAASATILAGTALADLVSADSPLHGLIAQARDKGQTISGHGLAIRSPRIGARSLSADVTPFQEDGAAILVQLHEGGMARHLDKQLNHRSAARSVTAMAAMLAHEIKNPLSGIRGAAQLLEQEAGPEDRRLTRLICEETDRIVGLVDQMDLFGDERPFDREAVNIHEVLEHVRRLVTSARPSGVEILDDYDPSLPPVLGSRDRLIQVFLNLITNAAEALGARGGRITLRTRFISGVRLAMAGPGTRVELPLVVAIEDDGPGIPEDLQAQLFEPFVTTKSNGRGLGLALVAKIVGDHGGAIECDSSNRRTVFSLRLPFANPSQEAGDASEADGAVEGAAGAALAGSLERMA